MLRQTLLFPTLVKVDRLEADNGGGWIWGPMRTKGKETVARLPVSQRNQSQPMRERIFDYPLSSRYIYAYKLHYIQWRYDVAQ